MQLNIMRLPSIVWAAVAVAAALLLILGPSVLGLPTASADVTNPSTADCKVHYYALDDGKETTGAFGPAVQARDESGIKADLKQRRTCDSDNLFDPALIAAHYLDWATATLPDGSAANLTSQKVTWTDVDSFTAVLATNSVLRDQVVAELEKLENNESTFSMEPVSVGQKSLYMMPTSNGGIAIKVGTVASDGTNIAFTHKSGAVIKYRLECGFQPNWVNPPGDVPVCAENECAPTPICPPGTTGTPPNCSDVPPPCTVDCTPTPPCVEDCAKDWDDSVDPPEGVTPQPNDPYEPPESVTPPSDPAPVVPDGETPSSETPAGGAEPAQPNRPQPDPGTGTTPGGNPGTVNPTDPVTGGPGANEGPIDNPFG